MAFVIWLTQLNPREFYPVDVRELNADFMTFAGHKGLFGPPGIGGLFVRDGIQLDTLAEGGTGKDSGKHDMTGSFPSNFEVGTHNLIGITGLCAGVRWVKQAGLDAIREHEHELLIRFIESGRVPFRESNFMAARISAAEHLCALSLFRT